MNTETFAARSPYEIEKLLMTHVWDLSLSTRAVNCLLIAKINTLRELVQYEMYELRKFRGLGQESAREIERKVREKGLSLGMDINLLKQRRSSTLVRIKFLEDGVTLTEKELEEHRKNLITKFNSHPKSELDHELLYGGNAPYIWRRNDDDQYRYWLLATRGEYMLEEEIYTNSNGDSQFFHSIQRKMKKSELLADVLTRKDDKLFSMGELEDFLTIFDKS